MATEGITVLNTETFLFLYYLGLGFMLFLGWMCLAEPFERAADPERRRSLRRVAVGLAVAGVLHPVLALAARDLSRQLQPFEGPADPEIAGTVRLTNRALAAALTLLTVVFLSQLTPLAEAPGLRQIGEVLPYG